jgi:hypothetical protein
MAVEPIEVVVMALFISSGETATVAAAATTSAVAAIFGFHSDSQQHTLCSVLGRLFNLGPGLQARRIVGRCLFEPVANYCGRRTRGLEAEGLCRLGFDIKATRWARKDDSIRFLVCCLSMLQRASGQSAVPKKR